MGREVHLGLSCLFTQLFLGLHHGQDLHAGPLKGVDEHVLRHKVRLAFNHGQGIGRGCEHELKVAFLSLGKGGVEHELAVDAAHAGAYHRAFKGQGGHVHGSRGCSHGQHVRIIFLIGRKHRGQDLYVLQKALGEEGTDGTVYEAGDQGLML